MTRVRRLQYFLLACAVILAPLLLAAWFTICPQYGNPGCPSGVGALAAFRAQDPTLTSAFLTVGSVIPYIYPLSYIGLALLAAERSPKLATVGVIFGWLGAIAWGFIAEQMFIGNQLARIGNDALATNLLSGYTSSWQTYLVATGWVLGHQLAYVLLGLALWKARVTPRWTSIMLIVSAPIMGPIAYGAGNGWLQVAGFGLVFIASVPLAIRIVGQSTKRSGPR